MQLLPTKVQTQQIIKGDDTKRGRVCGATSARAVQNSGWLNSEIIIVFENIKSLEHKSVEDDDIDTFCCSQVDGLKLKTAPTELILNDSI